MKSNVWKTLSAIDVSNHIDKKGGLHYLSWGWAWSTLCEHYPDSIYSYTEPRWCDKTNTVEVEVTVTVEGKAVTMWLPVMDFRNKAVENPTSRDISDARIRCLVKAIAMHGLGMCLYMGEVKPQKVTDATKEKEAYQDEVKPQKVEVKPQKVTDATKDKEAYEDLIVDLLPSVKAIKDGIAANDYSTANEAWKELTDVEKQLLWRAPSRGGVFSTQERAIMKTTEFREAN